MHFSSFSEVNLATNISKKTSAIVQSLQYEAQHYGFHPKNFFLSKKSIFLLKFIHIVVFSSNQIYL